MHQIIFRILIFTQFRPICKITPSTSKFRKKKLNLKLMFGISNAYLLIFKNVSQYYFFTASEQTNEGFLRLFFIFIIKKLNKCSKDAIYVGQICLHIQKQYYQPNKKKCSLHSLKNRKTKVFRKLLR